MRVAVVTESFLPGVNGVTTSVLRVLEQLHDRGHVALVVAPGDGPITYAGARVVRTPAVPLPVCRSFALGMPSPGLLTELERFAPDVVHLASPIALGAQAAAAAGRLGVPAVAVYQTDVAGFATRYRLGVTASAIWRWLRWIHGQAARTLAPSRHAVAQLERHGVAGVHLWPRGVDLVRFAPRHRDSALRRRLAPRGEVLVGYVGRLAREKRLHFLTALQGLEGCRLVIIGDGPERRRLRRRLRGAAFLGFLQGAELAQAFASLDLFVHPGADETFCQAAQEALASGVPVVAPAAGGLTDLVSDGENGLLWWPEDPRALREAVRTLLARPLLRQRMAQRARQSVAARTWPAVCDQLLAQYAAVTTAKRSAEVA